MQIKQREVSRLKRLLSERPLAAAGEEVKLAFYRKVLSFSGVAGLTAAASKKAILHAYKALSKLVHPDQCRHEGATEAFQLLSEAKDTLLPKAVAETSDEQGERVRREEDERRVQQEAEARLDRQERERREAERSAAEEELRTVMRGASLAINVFALARAADVAERLGIEPELVAEGRRILAAAQVAQERTSCEMAGGFNRNRGCVRGSAVRTDEQTRSDQYVMVGVFGCNCGNRQHYWALETSGQTGHEPFGPNSQCTYIGEAMYESEEDAERAAAARYEDLTSLGVTQRTEPPVQRPGQWSSPGLCLTMVGAREGEVIWQFELVPNDAPDNYQPGWHNYKRDPETNEESTRIVEQLWGMHTQWGGGHTGRRHVRSGKFAYSLEFEAGAGTDAAREHAGIQTNTKTDKRRRVRRVLIGQACTCPKCREPPPVRTADGIAGVPAAAPAAPAEQATPSPPRTARASARRRAPSNGHGPVRNIFEQIAQQMASPTAPPTPPPVPGPHPMPAPRAAFPPPPPPPAAREVHPRAMPPPPPPPATAREVGTASDSATPAGSASSSAAPAGVWEFQESRKSNTWKPFDEASARALSQAMAHGRQHLSLTVGNGTQYSVDLSNPDQMTQTNAQTAYVRRIRCRPTSRAALPRAPTLSASASVPTMPIRTAPARPAAFPGVGGRANLFAQMAAAAQAGTSAAHSVPPTNGEASTSERLLAQFAPNGHGLPSSWATNGQELATREVPSTSEEHRLVATHLKATLNAGRHVKIGAVVRVENAKVFGAFERTEETAVMFHGCQNERNEASILKVGFQVHMCKSGGNNYGTWLAYNASYSDGGRYVFTDVEGWRHLFVCVASKHGVKKDNDVMRVVGQGGAIPLWIVRYRHE